MRLQVRGLRSGIIALSILMLSGLLPDSPLGRSARASSSAAASAEGVLWRGGFATGDLSEWTSVHAGRVSGVTVQVIEGRQTGVIEVRPGDHWQHPSTERSELVLTGLGEAGSGDRRGYAWSSRIGAESVTSPGGWQLLTQWHQSAHTCPPNLAIEILPGNPRRASLSVRGGRIDLTSCSTTSVRQIDLGVLGDQWESWGVEVVWHAAAGSVRVVRNGQVAAALDSIPTLYEGQRVYLKQGLYRSAMTHTSRMWLRDSRIGDSLAALTPRRTPLGPWRRSG